MPHVVIEGPITAARVHQDLALFEERRPGLVMKLLDSYLSRSNRSALLEAVVVEGVARRFLISIEGGEGGVTVRLYPPTDPEKTAGIKQLVAQVGSRVCRQNMNSYKSVFRIPRPSSMFLNMRCVFILNLGA